MATGKREQRKLKIRMWGQKGKKGINEERKQKRQEGGQRLKDPPSGPQGTSSPTNPKSILKGEQANPCPNHEGKHKKKKTSEKESEKKSRTISPQNQKNR